MLDKYWQASAEYDKYMMHWVHHLSMTGKIVKYLIITIDDIKIAEKICGGGHFTFKRNESHKKLNV